MTRQRTNAVLTVQRTVTRIRGNSVLRVTLVFEWEGGQYVDVCRRGETAFDVINVMDASGVRTIPFTQRALAQRVDAWIREYGKSRLALVAANS